MKLGRHLINTSPNTPRARREYSSETEWQHHLDYISLHVVGPPKGTAKWSVKELEEQGMIGIYAHP